MAGVYGLSAGAWGENRKSRGGRAWGENRLSRGGGDGPPKNGLLCNGGDLPAGVNGLFCNGGGLPRANGLFFRADGLLSSFCKNGVFRLAKGAGLSCSCNPGGGRGRVALALGTLLLKRPGGGIGSEASTELDRGLFASGRPPAKPPDGGTIDGVDRGRAAAKGELTGEFKGEKDNCLTRLFHPASTLLGESSAFGRARGGENGSFTGEVSDFGCSMSSGKNGIVTGEPPSRTGGDSTGCGVYAGRGALFARTRAVMSMAALLF